MSGQNLFDISDLVKSNKYTALVMGQLAKRNYEHCTSEEHNLDFHRKKVTLLHKMFEVSDVCDFKDIEKELQDVLFDICFNSFNNIIGTFKIKNGGVDVNQKIIDDIISMFRYIWTMTDKECFNKFRVYLNIATLKEVNNFDFMSLKLGDSNIPNNFLQINLNLVKDNTNKHISIFPTIDLYEFSKDWDGTDKTSMYNLKYSYLLEDLIN